ncbi:MAG: Threonine synthase [Candidatus Bathyarchaeota archaeon BA1]|nr:MAG: Threonine synthase [Candidatus Bathyarchaeota archaeon BA1]
MSLGMGCDKCGGTYPLDEMVYRCVTCNYPLEVRYDYDAIATRISKKLIRRREWNIWRYKELLPVTDLFKATSIGEGGTSLQKSVRLAERIGIKNLYLKDETRNPTWSFKDRGSSVGVSKALEIGANAVGCVSTGNMAASLAAYAAKAGIKCVILMPSGTPLEKITQMLVCGANVISMERPYPEIYKAGLEISKKYGIYWVHADAPMRIEGQKTSSYEICEQLGWDVPDRMIIPTSSGGNISAHWKGWKELKQIGFVEKLPSMVAIQAEGCCPIVRAFQGGKEFIEPFKKARTIAHSILNPDPPSGQRVLKLLKESNGMAEAVSDKELLDAQKLLAETEGIFAEPAGAASVAGLKKLLEKRVINKDEKIVCVVTGAGLKDVKSALKICGKPIRLKSWDDCRQLLESMVRGI